MKVKHPQAPALYDEETDQRRRSELARFLRTSREALKPTEGEGRRRRSRGLLREEIASAAGISSTWYMWMEQARPIGISPRALNGLARALQLDDVSREYLFRLARPDLRPIGKVNSVHRPSPVMAAIVHALSPHPVYVLNERWDFVLWNDAADFLFGEFSTEHPLYRNVIGRLFCDPTWNRLFKDWEAVATSAARQFRSVSAGLVADQDHQKLVETLLVQSPLFAGVWRARGS